MTTKAEEREALNQIKEILSRLEPDGYLNTAFDGCLFDAEENIENDFAMSWKQTAESEAMELKKAIQKNEELSQKCKDLQSNLDQSMKYANLLEKQKEEMIRDMTETSMTLNEARETVEKQTAEILKLKAKLYDFMIEEEGK